jgi:uncharacterized protein (DUF1501 family)
MDRRLLIKSGLASLGLCASNQLMGQSLGLLNTLASANSASLNDYKTLVMVFLTGGMDSLGLIIPTEASAYSKYRDLRQQLAIPTEELLDFGYEGYAVPSFMQNMVNLYQQEKLAWVSNVGPLREPSTKAMIENNSKVMPLFIGSHNSQQVLWQSGSTNPSAREGWGARMLELMNLSPTPITPNISLDRTQLFTTTLNMQTFAINPFEVQNIPRISEPSNEREAFYKLQNLTRDGLLDLELTHRNLSTLENNELLMNVLGDIPAAGALYPSVEGYSAKSFQQQLKMAARMIEAAPALGQHRQVIMVQMHGFDTHDNQDRDLPKLINAIFANLEAFQQDLEARGLDERVVTFNQSDFGRTPTINANGTDHGWGGHYFMMGTPVRGGKVIGAIPEFGVETEKMLYNLSIPDFSVEQYAANIAKWFGLSASEINEVFPNYARFDDVDFGVL